MSFPKSPLSAIAATGGTSNCQARTNAAKSITAFGILFMRGKKRRDYFEEGSGRAPDGTPPRENYIFDIETFSTEMVSPFRSPVIVTLWPACATTLS